MDSIIVNADLDGSKISRDIYGHFSEHLGRCIYGGFWVGKDSDIPNISGYRKDVVEAFKELEIPNLRWPGGCFADEYHWRDGVGPYETRKRMINTHWGGVVEDNSFGTNEFFGLCELLGCKAWRRWVDIPISHPRPNIPPSVNRVEAFTYTAALST